MKLVYTLDPIDITVPSIYLAGPTYRRNDGNDGWRNNVIRLLNSWDTSYGWDGVLYIPEWVNGIKPKDWFYSRQVSWETQAMEAATVILFWIPRDLQVLPGFTTNIEFGEFLKSGKIVVGAPKDAPNIRYIFERCSRYQIPTSHYLETCIKQAIDLASTLMGKNSSVYFTADTHFNHQRTLELSKRPFPSCSGMNSAMVFNWNEVVSSIDTVYHLGDFGDPSFIQHLNGEKIFILPGNYDTPDTLEALTKDPRVSIIKSCSPYQIGDNHFVMVHAPEEGALIDCFYLFGHIHKLQMVKQNGLNVGVDCHNFTPISESDIMFYRNAIFQHYNDNVFIPGLGIHS